MKFLSSISFVLCSRRVPQASRRAGRPARKTSAGRGGSGGCASLVPNRWVPSPPPQETKTCPPCLWGWSQALPSTSKATQPLSRSTSPGQFTHQNRRAHHPIQYFEHPGGAGRAGKSSAFSPNPPALSDAARDAITNRTPTFCWPTKGGWFVRRSRNDGGGGVCVVPDRWIQACGQSARTCATRSEERACPFDSV